MSGFLAWLLALMASLGMAPPDSDFGRPDPTYMAPSAPADQDSCPPRKSSYSDDIYNGF
jgi:hypothetical protein